RARRRLYLTHAQSRMLHGQLRYNVASRFLDELPAGVVRWPPPQRYASCPAQDYDENRNAPGSDAARPGWRIGQSVKHAKFGLGIIIDAEGRGGDARVQVNFRDAGVKWLALEYAKLQPARQGRAKPALSRLRRCSSLALSARRSRYFSLYHLAPRCGTPFGN